jgi:hypothetical protein
LSFSFQSTKIGSKIDFLSRPETCFGFLVVAPDVIVLDREEDEPIWGCPSRIGSETTVFWGKTSSMEVWTSVVWIWLSVCLVHILLCSLPCGNGFSFFPLGPLEFPQ